jgi:cytochrome c-type biogenesis protein CcmH/NrfF
VRRVALLVASCLLAAALALPAAVPAQQASLPDIEDEVMCPICGTTLELSESPQADRQREFIRALIDEGRSKDEVKDALVAEYGEDVLAVPGDEGFDLAAWVIPILGIVGAAVAIGLAIARLGRGRAAAQGPAVDPEQSARLDRDMKGYDL